jgi:hypothetical protein
MMTKKTRTKVSLMLGPALDMVTMARIRTSQNETQRLETKMAGEAPYQSFLCFLNLT